MMGEKVRQGPRGVYRADGLPKQLGDELANGGASKPDAYYRLADARSCLKHCCGQVCRGTLMR